MSVLVLDDLAKSYGDRSVLDGMSLTVGDGEFVSLLGPSGCGKTTTLNIIGGFVAPDSGRVLIGDEDATRQSANKRNTAMVFQNYALFPHLTVAGNVGYGLRVRRVGAGELRERVAETLRMLGIEALAERYPGQLSGGQQQRVAVARAVVVSPGVLLMDEPLSNLDAKLRAEVRTELRAVQQRLGQTVVFVTHDQDEALTMSDRIVVMNAGKVEQIGTPEEVYETPRTVFVADFMGVGNIFTGAPGEAGVWVSQAGLRLPGLDGAPASVGIRPSDVEVDTSAPAGDDTAVLVPGQVRSTAYMGDVIGLDVLTEHGTIRATVPRGSTDARSGDDVTLRMGHGAFLPLEPSAAPAGGVRRNEVT